jgi:hypothetical protein
VGIDVAFDELIYLPLFFREVHVSLLGQTESLPKKRIPETKPKVKEKYHFFSNIVGRLKNGS